MCLNIRWGIWALCLTFKVPHILSVSFVFQLTFHLAILPLPDQSTYYSLNITTEAIFQFKATAHIVATVMNAKSQTSLTILWRVSANPSSGALFLNPLSPPIAMYSSSCLSEHGIVVKTTHTRTHCLDPLLLTMWPWADYLPSLCLSFLSAKGDNHSTHISKGSFEYDVG